MNIQEAQAAVEAAETALEAARAEFGEALASGSASDALRKKVTKAEAAAEDALMAHSAIVAAETRAARAAQEREEREAQERLEQLFADFQKDHGEWVNVAGEIDGLLDQLVDAFGRYEMRADHLAERYRELPLNSNIVAAAKNVGGRYSQVLLNWRNFGPGKLRTWLYSACKAEVMNGTGHKRTFVDMTPAVSAFFVGKEPKKRKAA